MAHKGHSGKVQRGWEILGSRQECCRSWFSNEHRVHKAQYRLSGCSMHSKWLRLNKQTLSFTCCLLKVEGLLSAILRGKKLLPTKAWKGQDTIVIPGDRETLFNLGAGLGHVTIQNLSYPLLLYNYYIFNALQLIMLFDVIFHNIQKL